jgi:DNA-binding SARP family transcriptional activator
MVYDLLLQPHFQQYREAEKIGANLLNFSTSIGNSFIFGLALLYLGRNSYYEGNYEKARDFLNRSHQVLSSEEVRAEYHLHLITILNGFISCHLQQHGNVEKNLRNTLDYFNSLSSFLVVDTHFAMALLKYSQANTDESIAHLGAGLKISREKGYYNFPLTSPRDLLKICILALELEVKGGIDYAAYLLTTRLTSLADPELKKFAHHPSAKIREKAWEIRKKIHLSKAPQLRIETLGGLKIYRGDSLIEEKEWDRKQPKQLLMTLLAHRGNGASKEILIDDFWPDEKPGTAEKNFKTTLQRLRKSLESVLHGDFGSSYIHLDNGNVFLNPELCEVDVDQFSSLITKAEAEEKRRETKAALLGYQAAADLYKGDFLPEEIHLSLVDMKREEVRQKYIDILIKMGQLHEKQGASRKAIECHKKAIQTDPLLEETYQRLMTLYSNKRMYNEALKTYEACKKALKAGLKTEPDSTTNALYKKVIENVNKG